MHRKFVRTLLAVGWIIFFAGRASSAWALPQESPPCQAFSTLSLSFVEFPADLMRLTDDLYSEEAPHVSLDLVNSNGSKTPAAISIKDAGHQRYSITLNDVLKAGAAYELSVDRTVCGEVNHALLQLTTLEATPNSLPKPTVSPFMREQFNCKSGVVEASHFKVELAAPKFNHAFYTDHAQATLLLDGKDAKTFWSSSGAGRYASELEVDCGQIPESRKAHAITPGVYKLQYRALVEGTSKVIDSQIVDLDLRCENFERPAEPSRLDYCARVDFVTDDNIDLGDDVLDEHHDDGCNVSSETPSGFLCALSVIVLMVLLRKRSISFQ